MNLFQLECFLAVAECLNFARAAEKMNITQPSITHQIRSLETELNTKLFHRTTRTVALTAEGRIFLHDAENIVFMSLRAIHRFQCPDSQPILDLVIGCQGFAGLQDVPVVFQRLAAEYPNLHPHTRTFSGGNMLDRVEDGSLDAALGFREKENKKSSLQYKELKKVSLVCILRSEHPLAERESIGVDELSDQTLVLYDPVHTMTDIAQLQWELTRDHTPSDLHLCELPESALLLTEADLGISILPDIFYPLEGLHIKAVPLKDVEKLSWGVHYKSFKDKPVLRDFVRFMQG